MLNLLKKIIRVRAEKFFIITALTFGIITVFVTPPLQSPDEDGHFFSAWRFSSLKLDRYFSANMIDFVKMHRYLYFHPHKKYSAEKFKQALSYESDGEDLDKGDGKYYNLRVNTIPSYLPCIVGMSISKLFSDNFCINMWFARLVNLLCYSIIVFYAIKISPCFKWGFVLLGLMPMTLFLASSLSYDSFTTAFCYLIIAVTLKYFIQKERISFSKDWLFLLGLAFLSLLKCPYFLVAFPLFFLKKCRFEANYVYYFKGILALIFCLQVGLYFTSQMLKDDPKYYHVFGNPKVKSGKKYDRTFGSNNKIAKNPPEEIQASERIKKVLTNPADFIVCFCNTLTKWDKILLYGASFGGCLGWLDSLLPPLSLAFFYLVLIFSPFTETHSIKLKFFDRSIFMLTGLGIFVLLHLIFYVVLVKIFPHIEGVQGRYFIPLAPLLLIPFISTIGLHRFKKKRLFRNAFFMLTVLMIQTASIVTLLQRYYFTYSWIDR